ncbi:MAG: aspartate/glutamate racemase family protein [Roseburia sp.]|nr:aspartate/glutamate racemase family protein [Roseburia sp.]
MRQDPIGVFDSGVGGLCVLKKCAQRLPRERFIYLADTANMPYGGKSAAEIKLAACRCADVLFSMGCKALVIACNTATVCAIDDIRALYGGKVIIGLEPAIKPCYKELGRGYALALVTSATESSHKCARLLAACGGRIKALGQPWLAKAVEDNIENISAIKPRVFEMLEPYGDAEAVVLGCSHYTYIADMIREFYCGNIKIYDGADGAAARLEYCLALAKLCAETGERGSIRFYSTFSQDRHVK